MKVPIAKKPRQFRPDFMKNGDDSLTTHRAASIISADTFVLPAQKLIVGPYDLLDPLV